MQLVTKIKKKLKRGSWYPFYNFFYENVSLDNRLILLESRSGSALESNILAILKELNKDDYKRFQIILSVRGQVEKAIRKKLQYYHLHVDKMIHTGSPHYYYYLSRAGYLINDTSFPGRFIKKDGQIYLNTWHGTPLKKMGRDNRSEIVSMGNVMRNLLCADYLVFPNQYMEEKMADAYMLRELYRGTVLREGYPRNDVFRYPEKGMALKKESGLEGKRLIAYLPTFRGKFNQVEEEEHIRILKKSFQIWDRKLKGQDLVLVKLHPFVHAAVDFSGYTHIRAFPEQWDTSEGLNACDVLITDYSSVMYDYANAGKKIILYTYDFEDYLAGRGIYDDITAYPFQVAQTAEKVLECLSQAGGRPGEAFMEKYATYEDGNGTSRICREVFLKEACCRKQRYEGDGKENILIYGGDLALNGITTALCSMLRELDRDKYHYFVSFRSAYLKDYPERLKRIPNNVDFYPLASEMNMDLVTMLVYIGWLKFGWHTAWVRRRIDRAFEREWKKHFGTCDFYHVVHYNGYEMYVTSLLQKAPCQRTIWVHNDMPQEIRTRQNQSRYLLRLAYRSYDHVIAVSEDILDGIYRISGKKDNVSVIGNLHEYQEILKRAEKPMAFDKNTVSNMPLAKIKEILAGDADKFINIGRFSPEKGQDRLIDAFDRYWEKHGNAYLFIIGGGGSLYQDIRKLAETKKSAGNIVLIRSMSNPMPVLKKCDLFLLSSYYEGLGLVLLEADTLGVPVAACDAPGPRGFLREHGGMIVENSAEGLLYAMEQYRSGKLHVLNVDYEAMNQESLKKCEQLLAGKL